MSQESTDRPRLQDDPDVVAYQFINSVTAAHGEVRLGGMPYLREGLTWDEVFDAVSRRHVTQFLNQRVIVFRKAETALKGRPQGFKRF